MRSSGVLMLMVAAAIGVGAGAARADVGSCDHLPPRGAETFKGHHVVFGSGEINGTPGDDFIVGSNGHDTIHGGGGQDIVCARGGADVVYGDGMGDDLHGQGGNDKIFGGLLDDHLYGEGGGDLLVGGHGVDDMYGGVGSDWLRGGTNNDLYFGDDPRDRAAEPGVDVASFQDVTPSATHADAKGVVVNLTNVGQHGAAPHTAVGDGIDDVHGIESVIGSPFDDIILADGVQHSKLYGGMGDDACSPVACSEPTRELHAPFVYLDDFTPLAGESPDPLVIAVGDSRAEQFTLAGKLVTANEAIDTLGCDRESDREVSCSLRPDHIGGGIAWFGGAGDDGMQVKTGFPAAETVDLDGGPDSDTIAGGKGSETIYSGNTGNDVLNGGAGPDALIAEGKGADTLHAGPGDDQLVTTNPCEGHTYRGGAGIDIAGFARTANGSDPNHLGIHAALGDPAKGDPADLQSAYYGAAFRRGADGSNRCPGGARTHVGGDNEILEGTRNSDVLIGNDRADTIWGRQGNDEILGLGGDDRLEGMENKDTIDGGAGADVLLGGPASDRLHARDGRRDERVDCGPGRDTVEADRADPVVNCEGPKHRRPPHKRHKPQKHDRSHHQHGPKPPHKPKSR